MNESPAGPDVHEQLLPRELPDPPAVVHERLRSRLLLVRSVWFPTPRELRAWSTTGLPLYVRPLGPRRVEVGPRLHSMWASCFSPVDELVLGGEQRTTLTVQRRLPRFTLGLLVVWWVVTVAWGAAGVPQVIAGLESPAWLLFWTVLAVASTGGPAMGFVMGGKALDEAAPWLRETLETPDVEEDW